MGYSNFKTLEQVTKTFELKTRIVPLIADIQPIEPSTWLKESLELAYMIPLSNEKVKSERLISPVLTEVHRLHQHQLSLFSGTELNVDTERNLNGACDFLFSAVPQTYILEAPIVSLTEAKNENLDYGIAQCTAQMIGAQLFNEQRGQPTPTIWGCSTTAGEWKFLKLVDNVLYVDIRSFYVNRVDILLGAFHAIFKTL